MDYRFLRTEKDPIIGLIQTELQDQYGDITHEVLQKVSLDSGVSVSALRGWFLKDTLHPQNITTRMVLQALNCRVKIFRQDGTEVRGPRHGKNNGRKSEARTAQAASAAH